MAISKYPPPSVARPPKRSSKLRDLAQTAMQPLSKPTPLVHTHTNKLPNTLGFTLQLWVGWLEMEINAMKLDLIPYGVFL